MARWGIYEVTSVSCFYGCHIIFNFTLLTNKITIIWESLGTVSFTPLPQDWLVYMQQVRDAECDRSLMIIVGDVQ